MTSCNMFHHYFSVSDCLFSFTMGWDRLENFPDFRWISTHCRRNNPVWNWKIIIEHVTGGHMSLLWPILCVICSLGTLILRSAEIRSWELGEVGIGRGRDWEKWDSGCHRTSDSDPNSKFDIQSMCLDIMNTFWTTILTYRPIWKSKSTLVESM